MQLCDYLMINTVCPRSYIYMGFCVNSVISYLKVRNEIHDLHVLKHV